jgi:butyrate kinase
MDGDFSSNGLMKRTGAGTYTVDANAYITLTSASSAHDASGMRKITASTSSPSGGASGDIWVTYTA